MTTKITDHHRDEYCCAGYTILRGVIPSALLTDLRRETDTAREIARRKGGPQSQRLQPVYNYSELNHRPFRDFLNLPIMRAAVAGILGPDHTQSEIMGVLLDPAESPWCTNWHRDVGHHGWRDMPRFFQMCRELHRFNQINAALYDDHSLWVVPHSHNREDTDAERAAFASIPAPGPSLTDAMSREERELACHRYARQMPGAKQVMLAAGDVAFYRACQWHLGLYVPYVKRATLHDGFYCEADRALHRELKMFRDKAPAYEVKEK